MVGRGLLLQEEVQEAALALAMMMMMMRRRMRRTFVASQRAQWPLGAPEGSGTCP
jgi:hypothetical protein